MNLRTLLTLSMAAMLVAGCSGGGGGGSVTPSNANNTAPVTSGGNGVTTLAFKVDGGQLQAALTKRSPQFVAPISNLTLNYAIWTQASAPVPYMESNLSSTDVPAAGSSYSGQITLPGASNCTQSGASPPYTYTCTITVASGIAYDLQANLVESGTIIAYLGPSGAVDNYVPFAAILPGNTETVASQMTPVLHSLSFSAPATQFYEDATSTVQTLTTTTNVLDPESNVITSYYGPVANYPELELSVTSGATSNSGVTAPSTGAGSTVNLAFGTPETPGAPATAGGYTSEIVDYTPSSATAVNNTELALALTAPLGTPGGAPTVSIPYSYFDIGAGGGTGSVATNAATTIPGVGSTTPVTVGAANDNLLEAYFPVNQEVLLDDGTEGFVGHVTADPGGGTVTVEEDAQLTVSVANIASGTTLYATQVVYLPASGPTTATVTENVTAGGTADTTYTVTTGFTAGVMGGALTASAACAGDATIGFGGTSPGTTNLTSSNNTTVPNAGPTNLYITADNTGPANGLCNVTVASNKHAAMTSLLTLVFPSAAITTITSHARH